MTKERELLRRLLTSGIFDSGLYEDWEQYIKELLAKPEQEPVAWMYEWYEGDTESTNTYCGSEKPFQEDEVKPFNLRPLYEHPKREPLSDEEIHAYLSLIEPPFLWDEGFCSGIEWAEKQHGIGGGE